MTMTGNMTVELGDLVVAAFDEAARYSSEPREISRLAARTVDHILRRGQKTFRMGRRARRLLMKGTP